MSTLNVDKVDPNTGTTLELGTSGDTVSIPSGVTLSGAGTITASAANLAASGAGGVTGTLPIANGGTASTSTTYCNLTSNVTGNLPVGNLNSGTSASSSTFWRGDGTWVAPSGGAALTGSTDNTVVTVTGADAIQGEANLKFDGTDLTVETGNVVIGTAGKGIDFSAQTPTSATGATASGEVLNHYETGSWTPILQDDSTAIVSYNAQVGEYTRIGNWVCASFRIIPNDMGSIGTSSSTFTGLPFVINSATYHAGTMQMQGLKTSNLIPNLCLIHYPGQAKGAVWAYRETTSTSSIFPASTYWDNDTTIGGLFMYQTDA